MEFGVELEHSRGRGGVNIQLISDAKIAQSLLQDVRRGFAQQSPRARGNPMLRSFLAALMGPIPACAGKPHRTGRSIGYLRAYPRVRGGTLSGTSSLGNSMGLSPRARGNLMRRIAPSRRVTANMNLSKTSEQS